MKLRVEREKEDFFSDDESIKFNIFSGSTIFFILDIESGEVRVCKKIYLEYRKMWENKKNFIIIS